MKQITAVVLLLLFACNPEPRTPKDRKKDSIYGTELVHELDSIRNGLVIKTSNKDYQRIIDSLLVVVDTLQADIKRGQMDRMELVIIELKIKRIINNDHLLINKINILNAQNQSLKDSNSISIHKLETQQEHINAIAYEKVQLLNQNSKLQSVIESTKPAISQVSIGAYYFYTNLFGHTRKIETRIAKQADRIEIRYVVVPNKMDTKKQHSIETTFRKLITFKGLSSTLIYSQEPDYKELVTFDKVQEFEPGNYTVRIKIDRNDVYENNFTLN